jgi:hypothetical protein
MRRGVGCVNRRFSCLQPGVFVQLLLRPATMFLAMGSVDLHSSRTDRCGSCSHSARHLDLKSRG